MNSKRKKKFCVCEVCGEEIPREKLNRHQFFLAGVSALLCRDMPKAKRRVYERISLARIKKAKARARSFGYTDPLHLEMFIRGLGWGLGTVKSKKGSIRLWEEDKKEESGADAEESE